MASDGGLEPVVQRLPEVLGAHVAEVHNQGWPGRSLRPCGEEVQGVFGWEQQADGQSGSAGGLVVDDMNEGPSSPLIAVLDGE